MSAPLLALTLVVLAVPYAAITIADRVQQRKRQAEDRFHRCVVLPFERRAERKRRQA